MTEITDAINKLKGVAAPTSDITAESKALSATADSATLPSPAATERLAILNLKLEKRKQNIELVKWLIGSVALVIMTTLINWSLKDREDSFKEVQEYNKYATDLIILNNDPAKRRMLAQFFGHVIPTEYVREGWLAYFKEIEPEYQKFLAKTDSAQKQYAALEKKPNPTVPEQAKKDSLSNYIQQNQALLKSPIVVPVLLSGPATAKPAKVVRSNSPALAAQWEAAGFEFLFQRDVVNAISAFENANAAYPTLHQVYEIAGLLRQRQAELTNKKAPAWIDIYATIAKTMSWQMPPPVKKKLLSLLTPAAAQAPEATTPPSQTAAPQLAPVEQPGSPPKLLYGPEEFKINLGYSQRIGDREDNKRLVNIALDKIDPIRQSVEVKISSQNEVFKSKKVYPHYQIQLGKAQSFPLYGFTYKLTLLQLLSNNSALLSIERYDR